MSTPMTKETFVQAARSFVHEFWDGKRGHKRLPDYADWREFWDNCLRANNNLAASAALEMVAQMLCKLIEQNWQHVSDIKVNNPTDDSQPIGWCAERAGQYAIECVRCELEQFIKRILALIPDAQKLLAAHEGRREAFEAACKIAQEHAATSHPYDASYSQAELDASVQTADAIEEDIRRAAKEQFGVELDTEKGEGK